MKDFLNEEEKSSLKIKHKTERDKRVADRIKAVLLQNEGWPNKLIAQALLIGENTVCKHLQDYRKEKKVKPENGGLQRKLAEGEQKRLFEHLDKYTYSRTKDICEYIKKTFSVNYSISGVTKLLQSVGFCYKKPKVIPSDVDPEKQKRFVRKYRLLKKILSEKSVLLFADAVHPEHQSKPRYGWIRIGIITNQASFPATLQPQSQLYRTSLEGHACSDNL